MAVCHMDGVLFMYTLLDLNLSSNNPFTSSRVLLVLPLLCFLPCTECPLSTSAPNCHPPLSKPATNSPGNSKKGIESPHNAISMTISSIQPHCVACRERALVWPCYQSVVLLCNVKSEPQHHFRCHSPPSAQRSSWTWPCGCDQFSQCAMCTE